MSDDAELLRRYTDENSQQAFAELVQRHLGLVYHAALRQCGGDVHRAEDVAQAVFTDLARKARSLSRRPALAGWLYTSVRYAASQAVRAERRRQGREQEVHLMNELLSDSSPAAEWERLRPVIDDALHDLNERDREAVLLRFFEGSSFAVVAAKFATSEDAARMRVDRALAKMRDLLARRGVTSTTAALGLALASQAGVAAPAGLAAVVTGAALAGAAATGTAAVVTGIFQLMSTTKVVSGIAGVVVLLAVGSAVYQSNRSRESAAAFTAASTERDALQARLSAAEQRGRELNEALLSTQKALAEPPAKAPVAAEASRPAASQVGPSMEYILEHPELHASFIQQKVLLTKTRFDRFFRSAGLSAEEEERFMKAVADGAGDELDLMAALHAKGYGVGNMPTDPQERAQLQNLKKERTEKDRASLRALLGDDRLRQLEQYSGTIAERNVADQLASQLYYTEAPLTPQQAEQLTQVLKENRFKPGAPSPENTMGGTFVLTPRALSGRMGQAMQQGGMSMIDWQNPITDAALARAQVVLTPAQFTALQRVQAQQAAQFQLAPPPPSPK